LRDLTVAVADMGLEPGRNVYRLFRGKRSKQTRRDGDADKGASGDSNDMKKERS
jgi:hypothetical protein